MPNYLAPGVYVENNDKLALNNSVAIGVAGFVGITQRGPIKKGVLIQSWNQYINNFANGLESPFVKNSDLAYAVYGFFQNGGSTCVVTRAAHSTAALAVMSIGDDETITAVIKASDEGAWGNKLTLEVAANEEVSSNFDITVSYNGSVVETISNLSNTSGDDNYWVTRVNNESSFIQGVSGSLATTSEAQVFAGGVDGVSDIVDADFTDALEGFEPFMDTLSYVAIPGQTSQTVLSALTEFCYDGSNVIPVLEAPVTATASSVLSLRKTNENFTGVLVWPWGNVTDPLSKAVAPNNLRKCPPSGHYMGVLSRIANARGIWKAPAGIEATVRGFVSVVTDVTKVDLESLNPAGVVSIQAQTNYGICVWGARTLNSTDDNFKYVSDLTLDAYIKRNCYNLGLPYVFEGNKESTWTSIQSTIEGFMDSLMRKGAFRTDKAETSYYVKCDGDLNEPHVESNDGIIEIEVGYAGVKPGEFIVFKVSHTISG